MKLERLDIRTLPGVYPGFQIDDLDHGVNFITGPNASGKSSTIRALRYLLDSPKPGDPSNLDLRASFRIDGQVSQVQREGSRIQWQIDGQPGERPGLPHGSALATWLITIEDLFKLNSDNELKLAERLRRELHGGFDLSILRSGEFKLQPRVGQREMKQLHDARDHVGKVEASQREVSERQQELPELERRIEAASAAARECRDLESALELAAARGRAAMLESRLQLFPAGMDKLHGREQRTLAELEERANTLGEELERETRQQEQAREALEATGLADARPDETALQTQQQNLTRLEGIEKQLADEAENHARCEVRLEQARQGLQMEGVETGEPAEPDADSLRQAQELAGLLETHEAERDRLARQIEEAGEPVDERAIERHTRAIHALQDWLSTPPAVNAPDLKLPAILATTGAVIALVAGLLAIGWLAIVGAIVVAVAITLPWLGSRQPARDTRDDARAQLQSQGIEGPKDWSRASVQQRLADLEHARSALTVALERQQQTARARTQLSTVEAELETLQRQRRELAARIGFDPALTTRAMVQFVDEMRGLSQARLDLAQSSRLIERLNNQRAKLLEEIHPFFARWCGQDSVAGKDSGQLRAHLQSLHTRAGQARDALAKLGEADREIERLSKEQARTREQSDKLFAEAGLSSGQRAELQERLAQLDDWRELQRQLRSEQDAIAARRAKLNARPDLLEQAQSDDADGLESALVQSRHRAEQLVELSEKKGQINAQINEAGNARHREQAMAELSLAQDRLEAVREQVVRAEIAHFLLDEIEKEHRRDSEPRLLTAARAAFNAFTHNQWALEIIEGKEIGFRARDLVLDESRNLAQLSTATRMQLLLALRLGQIEIHEDGRPALPLLVDEALTASDHERAAVIMCSLQHLADQHGRQIIYLAAGKHEYHLWEQATGRLPKLIDLAGIRNRQPQSATPVFPLPETRSVPAPEGLSASEYARRLQVPPLDPRGPIGSVHLFHLMPDRLERLHELMQQWRINTLAQLEALLGSDAASRAFTDGAERGLLAQRARITRDWIETWHIGRGKPVDAAILEHAAEAGILRKETTYDGVAERAEELGRDAARLIENLAQSAIAMQGGSTRRLQSRQREALEALLIQNGYLSEKAPLDAADRRQRLIMRLAGQAEPAVIHQQVDWLEAAIAQTPGDNAP